MPRTVKINDTEGNREVATEQELLDFANAVRQAGGADVLGALLPSYKGNPNACLVANALNFSCSVDCHVERPTFPSGACRWVMDLPANLPEKFLKALKQIEGTELESDDEYGHRLLLPEHIGNAALAFDNGVAFQEYSA